MRTAVHSQRSQLLSANLPDAAPVTLDADTAVRLIKRIDAVRLHAHAYSFILNLTHGSLTPFDVLAFAYQHELQGVNIHSSYKDPSDTPFDDTDPAMAFLNEKRWANNQVYFIKSLLAELKWLAMKKLI